jgi:DNA-binding response OmpR family regulator
MLADADRTLAEDLATGLSRARIQVVLCADGAEALFRAGLDKPAVTLLGTPLPVVDAAAVTRLLVTRRIPVIVGVDAEGTREAVSALAAGATALVARPYRLTEILPLLDSHLVAAREANAERIALGDVELDLAGLRGYVRGVPLRLTSREFEVLRYFLERPNRVVPREQILHDIWGKDSRRSSTLTVHVKRVREKLASVGDGDVTITTVRGRGYRLEHGRPKRSSVPEEKT